MDKKTIEVRFSVRVPKELHDSLRAEAYETRKSLNQIVVTALATRQSCPNTKAEHP